MTTNTGQINSTATHMDRVAIKIPPFWKSEPRIWFINLEGQFALAGITADTTKYNYVIDSIDIEVLTRVTDILFNNYETNKYEIIKNKLISVYSESNESKIRKLLSDMSLGDKKPSELLKEMETLATGLTIQSIIKTLWMQQLSPQMHAILSTYSKDNLRNLADKADKLAEIEQFRKCAVTTEDNTEGMIATIKKLSQDVEELKLNYNKILQTSDAPQILPYQGVDNTSKPNNQTYLDLSRGSNNSTNVSEDLDEDEDAAESMEAEVDSLLEAESLLMLLLENGKKSISQEVDKVNKSERNLKKGISNMFKIIIDTITEQNKVVLAEIMHSRDVIQEKETKENSLENKKENLKLNAIDLQMDEMNTRIKEWNDSVQTWKETTKKEHQLLSKSMLDLEKMIEEMKGLRKDLENGIFPIMNRYRDESILKEREDRSEPRETIKFSQSSQSQSQYNQFLKNRTTIKPSLLDVLTPLFYSEKANKSIVTMVVNKGFHSDNNLKRFLTLRKMGEWNRAIPYLETWVEQYAQLRAFL